MGWDYVSELLPLTDILFIPQMIYEYGERRWNDIDRENRRTRRKTCPSATLSTTNPTWIDPGANPGLRGERPATNRLSHGTAACSWLPIKFIRNDDVSQSRRLPLTDGCGLDDRGLIPVLVLEFYFSPAFCVMQSPIQCVPRFMGDKATGAWRSM